jgi:hypothetical protein
VDDVASAQAADVRVAGEIVTSEIYGGHDVVSGGEIGDGEITGGEIALRRLQVVSARGQRESKG